MSFFTTRDPLGWTRVIEIVAAVCPLVSWFQSVALFLHSVIVRIGCISPSRMKSHFKILESVWPSQSGSSQFSRGCPAELPWVRK
jgi:hypothetical protein